MRHRRSIEAVKRRAERQRVLGISVGAPLYHRKDYLPVKSVMLEQILEFDMSWRNWLVKAVASCCLCGYKDVNALEVHHIDGHHNNNTWENIAVVCANCHTLLTKRKLNFWEELNRNVSKTRNECMSIQSRNDSSNG